ncbi:MAG: hypothetical protein P8X96_19495 [Desulfobacteraceae bacterium]
MRIINITESGTYHPDEKVFQSSGTGTLMVFIVCTGVAVAVTGSYIWYYIHKAVSGWLFLGVIWIAFWCGLMAWLAWLRLRAGLLPSNWLVKMRSEKVLIKFRSFQNYGYPQTDPVVIDLSWRDIAWVRKSRETSRKDKGGRAVTEFFTYLDIKLNLSREALDKIKSELNAERKRAPLRSSLSALRSELFHARKNKAPQHVIAAIKEKISQEKAIKSRKTDKSSAKYHDYPVRLVYDNILRVRWNTITPNMKKALGLFSKRTAIEDEFRFVTDSSKDLTGKELEEMILERVSRGDRLDAMKLAKKRYGYTTTAAKQFIDELIGK